MAHPRSPQFAADPRLRTFARALVVICIELDNPGSIQWFACEPIASYHQKVDKIRPTNPDHFDHAHLVATFHRLRGALVRRAKLVDRQHGRMADCAEVPLCRSILETDLWNAQGMYPQALERAKDKRVWRFLRSCATDLRREPLKWPLEPPDTYTDATHVEAVCAKFVPQAGTTARRASPPARQRPSHPPLSPFDIPQRRTSAARAAFLPSRPGSPSAPSLLNRRPLSPSPLLRSVRSSPSPHASPSLHLGVDDISCVSDSDGAEDEIEIVSVLSVSDGTVALRLSSP